MNRNFIPRIPAGNNNEARRFEDIHEALHPARRPMPALPVQAVSGRLAWHFDKKIEVDDTVSYPAQTVIHIQPTHDLVVTGIRDAANPSGSLVKSCAGFWVSTQAVSAKTTVSGNDVWNLPQWPLPQPLDYDDALNFWLYLGEMTG